MSAEARYMTPEGKTTTLAAWEQTRRVVPPPHLAERPGGYGYPDPEIFPLCDRLNALPGICTLQSCAGHIERDPRDGREYITTAHLWLWLDRETAMAFDGAAATLAARPGIERVCKQWTYFTSRCLGA